MTLSNPIFRLAILALCSVGMLGVPDMAYAAAAAQPDEPIVLAAADCYGIARRIAAERGGQVHSAEAASRNGRQVCVVVILVPAKGGQRGRRVEVVVPAE